MDAQQVFTLGQQGLTMLLTVAAPMLLTVLGVGLVVSIFQAATLVMAFAGPWMLTTLVEYVQRTLMSIPSAVG